MQVTFYHVIFSAIIVILVVSVSILSNKISDLRIYIIPFLIKQEFKLPKDRSLIQRTLSKTQHLLTKMMLVNVIIKLDPHREAFKATDFHDLFKLIFLEQNMVEIIYQNSKMSFKDFQNKILASQKSKNLIFKMTSNNESVKWEVIIET